MKNLTRVLALECSLVLGVAPALVGCATAVTDTNATLASLSNNSIPAACGIITVAEGYFNQLKPTISAADQAAEATAVAMITPICTNPPTNIAAAIATLATEWLIIQNATVATTN